MKKFRRSTLAKYVNLFIGCIRKNADFTGKHTPEKSVDNICLVLVNNFKKLLLHKQPAPLNTLLQRNIWRNRSTVLYFLAANPQLSDAWQDSPGVAYKVLSKTGSFHKESAPQLNQVCLCVNKLPCSSGDHPAGSSLVISSDTHRLCSSRVSTDRHRQSTRKPLEDTKQRTVDLTSTKTFVSLMNSTVCTQTAEPCSQLGYRLYRRQDNTMALLS